MNDEFVESSPSLEMELWLFLAAVFCSQVPFECIAVFALGIQGKPRHSRNISFMLSLTGALQHYLMSRSENEKRGTSLHLQTTMSRGPKESFWRLSSHLFSSMLLLPIREQIPKKKTTGIRHKHEGCTPSFLVIGQ